MENWLCSSSQMERDTPCIIGSVPPYIDDYSTSVQHYGYNSHFSWPMTFGEAGEYQSAGGSGSYGGDQSGSKSHKHSQVEKRRRDRINLQFSILRNLIPMSEKMDKAALLTTAVKQMKDLKNKSLEAGRSTIIPTEADEVAVDFYYDQEPVAGGKPDDGRILIRATLCCEDKPEVLGELSQALKGLKLKPIRADMACLGGRIKSVLIIRLKDGKEGGCLNTTIQSLRGVLNKIVASSSSASSSFGLKSKRQRFFFSSHNKYSNRPLTLLPLP